jgi:hypothetical protein
MLLDLFHLNIIYIIIKWKTNARRNKQNSESIISKTEQKSEPNRKYISNSTMRRIKRNPNRNIKRHTITDECEEQISDGIHTRMIRV